MEEQAKKNFIINTCFFLIWAGMIFVAGKFLLGSLFPFVIAFCVASVMQKPAGFISGKIHINKGLCAALLSTALYIALAGITVFLIFKIFSFAGQGISYITDFGNTFGNVLNRSKGEIDRILKGISPNFKATGETLIDEAVKSISQKLTVFLTDTASFIVKSAPLFLFNSIVALAATCYIAKDFDALSRFVKGLLKKETTVKIKEIKGILKTEVLKMLRGYFVLALITLGELFAGLMILGVKNAFLISLVTAVIDILPVLGVGAVLLPWGILSLMSGNAFLGGGILVLYAIITVARNFLESKIVGNRMGINPLFILLAMFLGLKIIGAAGIIILPVTLIVVVKYYKNEMEKDTSR